MRYKGEGGELPIGVTVPPRLVLLYCYSCRRKTPHLRSECRACGRRV